MDIAFRDTASGESLSTPPRTQYRSADRLLLLEVFLRTLERGSVSRAAEDLGMSQGRASKLLRELEDRMGRPLLRRNTHHLVPTEAGLAFAESARALLESWDGLLDEHAEERGGRVRLSVVASSELGARSVFELATRHAVEHGVARLRWHLDDSEIPFHRSGCDLWVRVGDVRDDSLVVTTVARVDSVVVAAPGHAAVPRVRVPADLEGLDAVGPEPVHDLGWRLTSADGDTRAVKLAFRIVTDDAASARLAARRGLGFAVLPLPWVHDDLVAGELVRVLPGWVVERRPVNLVHAPSRYGSALLKGLVQSLGRRIPEIDGVDGP